MLLYNLGRNPVVPAEIPYGDLVGVVVHRSIHVGQATGHIEYRTPKGFELPKRPKPIERLLLGKALYDNLIAEANNALVDGPPATRTFEFSFAGRDAETYASFLVTKFEEYAGSRGIPISGS